MSGPNLMPFDAALARLLDQAKPVGVTEQVPTMDAAQRVLAEAVVSPLSVPSWDNSQMDGYAVRCSDVAAIQANDLGDRETALRISQRIPAGRQGEPLAPGTVARIFTGAAIPPGADAVVMQELATPVSGDGDRVRFAHLPKPGEWIRREGEDIRAGATILPEGTRLTPQAIGLAASVGAASLKVFGRVRVACFFTGDELVMPGQPLPPGAIYNSNRFLLTALLRRLGCDVIDMGIVGDSLQATRSALREAAGGADLIVTSGGMSVGEEDHVKPAVEAEGELSMWQIDIKPGKPLAYGRAQGAHFIGLPGNPVSSFVTFLLFVRPFILALQGAVHVAPARLRLTAGFDWPRPDRRREFLRVSVDAQSGLLALFPNQGSAVLTSTVAGDGLLDNPGGRSIRHGDVVTYLPFSDLMN